MTVLYTFDLSKYVVRNPYKKKVTIGAISIVFAGIILFLTGYNEPVIIAASISCTFPIYHIALFRFMHKTFVRKYNREPVNASFNWSRNIGPDRVFALGFFFISVFSSFAIIAPIMWGTGKT